MKSNIPDHSVVIVYWNEKLIESKNSIIMCRDYKRMNVEEFKRMISSYLSTVGGDSIDRLANSVINVIWIVKCLDLIAPQRAIVLE